MSVEQTDIIIPSNPADIQKLKSMISEAENCKIRIAAEQEAYKEIVDAIAEEFNLPKKLINKTISAQLNHDYSKRVNEEEMFQLLYESVN